MGGGSTTNTTDEWYNQGLLALQQEDSKLAQEMGNLYKYGVLYDPNEQVQGYYNDNGDFIVVKKPDVGDFATQKEYQAAMANYVKTVQGDKYTPGVQLETRTLGDFYGYDPDAQVSGMDYSLMATETQANLLPLEEMAAGSDLWLKTSQNAMQQHLMGDQEAAAQSGLWLQTLQNQAGQRLVDDQEAATQSDLWAQTLRNQNRQRLIPEFYNQALQGVDVNRRVGQATADTWQGIKGAQTNLNQNAAMMGINPASGRFQSQMRNQSLDNARALGGARTAARDKAEEENFSRLSTAMNL